ncbi:Methylthioribulose-1-phosphate dehydratase [Dissoconium aciculare CBS 342.82]|uniref:Methylthioribulose-1-phosphate dehydratase n=1 Tax=Dissoconium aciculare CBS 342.82 TaxID=1314786 RepID=A0A6J3M913_9PEZI|nr:Methylthioribulose-1-phosphate dehydratase [Dissoconium aciculare CBS 342.82]KAF1824094.1 Methylthioribulose-1-phosphate dehydratase [Dissoconium aciculare CBS 342.82]
MVSSGLPPSNATSDTHNNDDALVLSDDPLHPANHICELCYKFYGHGWVTGTGGGISIKRDNHVYIAPSGVQKELMKPTDMFVMDYHTREYLRRPQVFKPSACTPLFMAAFTKRGASCCIHTHSQWAVLVTLICEAGLQDSGKDVFALKEIEQIKGISRGGTGSTEIAEGGRKLGNLGYFDTLKIPIIENTAHEEDLKDTLEKAIEEWPETCAVLVRRHGVYVWGKDVTQAKTQCESLDYIFQLAVEMHKLGLKWV